MLYKQKFRCYFECFGLYWRRRRRLNGQLLDLHCAESAAGKNTCTLYFLLTRRNWWFSLVILQAGSVILIEIEVRAQSPWLVPNLVPATDHVVSPLDPLCFGVQHLDVRLHLRPKLVHVGVLGLDPGCAPVLGQRLLVQLNQCETFRVKVYSTLCPENYHLNYQEPHDTLLAIYYLLQYQL